jgi:hypothetical protein
MLIFRTLTLKIEAACASETLVTYRYTRHYNLKDQHRCIMRSLCQRKQWQASWCKCSINTNTKVVRRSSVAGGCSRRCVETMSRNYGHQRAYCSSPRWYMSMGMTVEWHGQGKTEEIGERPVPVPLCPQQIPHRLTRDRTQVSAVRGRLLTACVMTRQLPLKIIWIIMSRPSVLHFIVLTILGEEHTLWNPSLGNIHHISLASCIFGVNTFVSSLCS